MHRAAMRAARPPARDLHRPAGAQPLDSNLISALVLGVVEGITEFIPVSSTGHLILARDLLGYPPERFDVLVFIIQLAAILAICLLYASRLIRVLVNLPTDPAARRFVLAIAIAFMPSVVLGLLLNDLMKTYLFSPWVVAAALLVGGGIILLIERTVRQPRYHDTAELPFGRALAVGFCQAVSMIPGVSRAGATIMGSVVLGLDRRAAAEFSFFLAIPTMLGASVLDVYKHHEQIDASLSLEIAVASVAAFVTAILVVRAFISYLQRHTFVAFGWYRIIAGAAMIAVLAGAAS